MSVSLLLFGSAVRKRRLFGRQCTMPLLLLGRLPGRSVQQGSSRGSLHSGADCISHVRLLRSAKGNHGSLEERGFALMCTNIWRREEHDSIHKRHREDNTG